MTTMNRQIVLAARPEGLPKPSDFRLVETPVSELTEGQFLVKTNYLSVDPYMRGRISEAKSYAEPVQIGQVMVGGTVGTVVESRHSGYRQGEVVGLLGLARLRSFRWSGHTAVRYLAGPHVHGLGRVGDARHDRLLRSAGNR